MNITQAFRLAWKSIIGNKMRSFLTMLGMIIGVASVIILISLMQGMTNSMVESFKSFGINNLNVSLIGRNGDIILTIDDMYKYMEEHKEVIGITPNVTFQTTLRNERDILENATITGVGEDYAISNKKEVEQGLFFQYADIKNREKVCVIGSYINKKVFGGTAVPGQMMKVNGDEYKIVGILKETAESLEWSEDNCVYIPYTTAARQAGIRDFTNYSVQIDDSDHVVAATAEMDEYLFSVYKNKDSYRVTNLIDMLNEINAQLGMMTALLAGIAGISLFVAGVGIMNIMLVSVSERTREIGIRKSLGAKKRDIMRQFVLEAGATSSIGGGIGIVLGIIAAVSIGKAIGFNAAPSSSVILISFGISAGIGIIFGYLPANKAAKLNPIDALRSE